MKRTLFRLAPAALAVLGAVQCGTALGADTNARDFFSAPNGALVGVVYLPMLRADEFDSTAGKTPDADLKVNALVYRHVWFKEVGGTLITPQFVVPLVNIDLRLPGAAVSQNKTGLGDPMVGATLFFVNDPAKREFSGLNVMLGLPVGQYDKQVPDASAGQHRWQSHVMLNYTKGLGSKWVVEGTLEAQVYGRNNDYFGQSLSQKPLYRLQAFTSYDFTPSTYGALRLYHGQGGTLSMNGAELPDTRQRFTQVGLELGSWVDKRNQVLAMVAHDVTAENRFKTNQLLLRLVHAY